jgi:lambda family phage portal protein
MNTATILDMSGKPITRRTHPQFYNGGLGNGAADINNASMKGWQWWGGSPDDDITDHLDVVRQRCRDLALNAPVVAGMLNTITTNVVGRGLIPEPTPDTEILGMDKDEAKTWKKTVLRYWEAFVAESQECDVRRRDNFYELQALVFRSMLESGDVFVTLPYVDFPGSQSLIDLRLQTIEADCISNPSMTSSYDREADIQGGVEVGQYGEVVAYHIAGKHPLSKKRAITAYTRLPEWTRIPAVGPITGRRNILHIMKSLRPGQRRGIPILAPVVESVKLLDRYTKAELQKALIQSLFTAVIKTPVPEAAIGEWSEMMSNQLANIGDNRTLGHSQQFYEDHGMLQMGAGTVGFIAPGDDIVPIGSTSPTSGFGPFADAQIKTIGAACGIPFEMVVMMFTSSYAASRAAFSMADGEFSTKRDNLVYDLCQPTYEEFMACSVAKGYIKAPGFFTSAIKRRAYCQAKWSSPPKLQIDPAKEAVAYERMIGLGGMTYSDVSARMGSDFRQNAEVLHEEQMMWEENGWVRMPLRDTRTPWITKDGGETVAEEEITEPETD